MKKISFDVTYNQEDYYEATKLHHRSITPDWIYYLGAFSFFVLGVFFLNTPGLRTAAVVFAIFLLLYRFLYLKHIARKVFSGFGFRPTHFEIDDSGLEEIGEKDRAKYSWNDIVQVLHNEKIVVLFIAKYRFYMVPKRAVTPEQWDELIQIKKK